MGVSFPLFSGSLMINASLLLSGDHEGVLAGDAVEQSDIRRGGESLVHGFLHG